MFTVGVVCIFCTLILDKCKRGHLEGRPGYQANGQVFSTEGFTCCVPELVPQLNN